MLAKKTLELNPNHPVIKQMLNELKENDNVLSDASAEYAKLLFQMAIINSGFSVENPMDLTEPLEKLIKVGFGLERDAPVEEIEIELDDEEEEDIEFDAADMFGDDDDSFDFSEMNWEEEEQEEAELRRVRDEKAEKIAKDKANEAVSEEL